MRLFVRALLDSAPLRSLDNKGRAFRHAGRRVLNISPGDMLMDKSLDQTFVVATDAGDVVASAEEQARAQALVEEKDSESRTRQFRGAFGKVVAVICVAFSLFQLYASVFATMDAMKLRAFHIIFLLVLASFMYPALRREKRTRALPTLWDLVCVCASLYAFGYLILHYDAIAMGGGWFTMQDYVVAGIGVLVAFECARRVVPNLAALALVFLAYTFLGKYLPGAFGHVGFSLTRVMDHMFWGSQGLLGVGVGVSATYVFLFVLFGAFLRISGFSEFINDLALTLVGRTAGGPAKVSVIASALMGMINGSALANVATTGAITIPLMKKTGYKAEFAGAVEAVASTGGQFAPPIMGAVGFIMAEFLGVSYTKVMLAAAIPAFLYYLALIMASRASPRNTSPTPSWSSKSAVTSSFPSSCSWSSCSWATRRSLPPPWPLRPPWSPPGSPKKPAWARSAFCRPSKKAQRAPWAWASRASSSASSSVPCPSPASVSPSASRCSSTWAKGSSISAACSSWS